MAAVTAVQTMSETDLSLVSQCMEYIKQLADEKEKPHHSEEKHPEEKIMYKEKCFRKTR